MAWFFAWYLMNDNVRTYYSPNGLIFSLWYMFGRVIVLMCWIQRVFCQRYLIPRLSHVKTGVCTVNTLIFSMQNMKNAGQPFISTKHVLSLKTTRHTWCFNIFYGSFIHSFDKNSCCLTSNRSLVWVIMRLKLFNFVIWKFYITDISRGKLNRNFHTKMR